MNRPRRIQFSSSSSSSSTSSNRRNQQASTNSDFDNMPVNLWGMDRRDVWRTCFCFHVRTVTIFIGVWHMMLYILALSFVAALVMYEQPGHDGYQPVNANLKPEMISPLPTPQSNVANYNKEYIEQETPRTARLTDRSLEQQSGDRDKPRNQIETMRNGPWNFMIESRKANSQVILLTVCNMLITLLMLYGAVRGKPSYLMPFFVLKVFDFCIFCLTMVGYFSYLPDISQILQQPSLPFREELLRIDPQLLSLLSLIIIVATIAVKAYIIGVIWNCYKYLMLRNTVIRGVIAYRHDDPANIMGLQQNLLPDLPDYDTAVNDPRYAKKPPMDGNTSTASVPTAAPATNTNGVTTMQSGISMPMPPPPPYSVAILGSEPVSLVPVSNIPGELLAVPRQTETTEETSNTPITTVSTENEVSVSNKSDQKEDEFVTVTVSNITQTQPATVTPLEVQKEQQQQ